MKIYRYSLEKVLLLQYFTYWVQIGAKSRNICYCDNTKKEMAEFRQRPTKSLNSVS
jgi:hypothetical protein